jgi:Tol biopolymer transport system component
MPGPEPPSSVGAGALAYINGDGNVAVYSPEGGTTIFITDDATAPFEGAGFSYQRLAWSPSGLLGIAGVIRQADAAIGTIAVWDPHELTLQTIIPATDSFVIYLYWSPAGDPAFVYLVEQQDQIALSYVNLSASPVSDVLGQGRPFYMSWSPDGQEMLWHTGGALGDNPDAQTQLFDMRSREVRQVANGPGNYVAPVWSASGSHWLLANQIGAATKLVVGGLTESTPITQTEPGQGDIAFLWSPSGGQVAYATRPDPLSSTYGPIYIYDLGAGSHERLTDHNLAIKAFWWSPEGDRIAYLTRLLVNGDEWLQWRVFDLRAESDHGGPAFKPSGQMGFVAAAFNQYAQSHRLWSADGRYLVYGAKDPLGNDSVWLLDTLSPEGLIGYELDAGSMGFWSFSDID